MFKVILLCTTLIQMQFMICQFLVQCFWRAYKRGSALKCRKVLCDELFVITHKSYSVTVMLVNMILFFSTPVCGCVCTSMITYLKPATGWVLLNSPQGDTFKLLWKEPHSSAHMWHVSGLNTRTMH